MANVLLLTEDDVRSVLDMTTCIEAVESAFTAYSGGRAELPAVIALDVPEAGGEIHVKGGYLHGGSYYAVKFASWFPQNPSHGLAASDGMVAVFDAQTGAPAAFLMDHGYITDLRTGAAGGVAAKHLAPSTCDVVAVIGTGTQARYQLDALARVRTFEEVRVWGRDPARAAACREDLAARAGLPDGCRFEVADSAREAVEGARVVITATASRSPVLEAGWLGPGMHVTALGSDGPDKQELEAAALGHADLLVVDSRSQCARIGELHHALEAGVVASVEDVVELGEITGGVREGRTSEDQLTICDLTGVGVQDVASAAVVMARAVERGAGRRIEY